MQCQFCRQSAICVTEDGEPICPDCWAEGYGEPDDDTPRTKAKAMTHDKTNAPAENPPAFPNTGNSNWNLQPSEGMTLRDWFAGQALSAVILHGEPTTNEEPSVFAWMAGDAYRFADAMLEARGLHD